MRTTLYTFLLVTCLLLTPYAVYAGTDDTGLQVFTVDFSKQLGESADVVQEDTLFSPYCYNMFSSGNGLTTLPQPKGSGYEWVTTGTAKDCAYSSLGALLVRVDGTSGTAEIYFHINPKYSSPTATRYALGANASTSSNSSMLAFRYGETDAVFLGNKILSITYGAPPTTAEVTLTGLAFPLASYPHRSAAIWQNRLFLCFSNYISYSAAQDFTNFTSSAAAGGITRLYDATAILKLISTKYGLYIFTDKGIYIQTGTGSKNSWQIEKISNLILPDFDAITIYNDIIYFNDFRDKGQKIWKIQGTSITIFAEIPYAITTNTLYSQMSFVDGGKFLILSSSQSGGTSFIYDVTKKTFLRSSEYNGFGSELDFIKLTSSGYKIYSLPIFEYFSNEIDTYNGGVYLTPLFPWAYRTSWITLDGNASNFKEIDRIEFDYQGGTTGVSLYHAYGNGSTAAGAALLTAPVNDRLSTYVWNAPIYRRPSNRFYLYFLSYGTQTMTTNFILKQARIYYRNIGNYKTNSLR